MSLIPSFRTALALAIASTFATTAAAQCCDHRLFLHDSYGDGWNGGTLELLVNGTFAGTFAAQGHGNDTALTLCTGDAIELIYTPQDYEEENTYVLYDPFGNVVFADGPTPATGTVFTGVVACDAVPAPGSVPCAALPIDTSACVVVDNSTALGTGIDPGCANYSGGDVWYAMPVPASGNVVVSTVDNGGLTDTAIALWTGPDCFTRTAAGCDDDGGDGYFSMALGSELPVGDTLWIQVFGYGGGTGTFQLCVSDPGTVVLESSELPIVLINTLDQPIVDEPKIHALMEIKYNGAGSLTYVTDPANVYDGDIGIEVRGASSNGYPQHPYAVETRDAAGVENDVPLLDMPAEHNWVLLSNYNDRSLVRNPLAFHLAQGMGQYAPRTHLCEVLIDSVYKGIYLLGEKVKRDPGRVNIAKLTGLETTGDDVTGGYILQQNYWDANTSFQSNFSPIDHPDFDVHFVYEYPKADTIVQEQRTYIAAFVDSLETALYGTDFADPELGYRKYMDVPSFISYFLVNEVSRSNDGFKKSVFFHKDKNSNGGKLKAGPVWDFDWAWKDLGGCSIFSATDGSGWAHLINDCPTDNYGTGWYVRLLQDPTFATELRCAYETYRTTVLDTTALFAYIDSIGDRVQYAQARHFQKWPILGISGPAPEVGAIATTYPAELDTLKAWIAERLVWLDANIPGTCLRAAVPENTSASALTCFPNPSTGTFHIQGLVNGAGPFELTFHDVAWRAIDRITLPHGAVQMDHTFPRSGTYFFTLRDRDRMVQVGKVIVL